MANKPDYKKPITNNSNKDKPEVPVEKIQVGDMKTVGDEPVRLPNDRTQVVTPINEHIKTFFAWTPAVSEEYIRYLNIYKAMIRGLGDTKNAYNNFRAIAGVYANKPQFGILVTGKVAIQIQQDKRWGKHYSMFNTIMHEYVSGRIINNTTLRKSLNNMGLGSSASLFDQTWEQLKSKKD